MLQRILKLALNLESIVISCYDVSCRYSIRIKRIISLEILCNLGENTYKCSDKGSLIKIISVIIIYINYKHSNNNEQTKKNE